jgi:hypothetical protein
MTLKQTNLAKAITRSTTMAQAGLEAGYSTKSRNIYRANTKKHIVEILEAQGITKDSLGQAYEGLIKLCLKKQDYSTAKSSLDSIAKMFNCLKDNSVEINQGVFSEDIMNRVRARLKSDVTP